MAAYDSLTPPGSEQPEVKLRSYQEEMLEASLRRNTIVAMDTGSGKTHIAIFRIRAELESCDPSKLVWFVSPSVQLSEQQYRVIAGHLPQYLVRTLLGKDGVDKWTDQRMWDAVLTNVRVVVGTPAVLADALAHGFVRISRLALLVFDEAHRCIKKGPMNVIMSQFYHPAKGRGEPVPHILGLTASPVMGANPTDLEIIEANLDARTVTPTIHRDELERFVHSPQISCMIFKKTTLDYGQTPAICLALEHAVEKYDLSTDPYFIELQSLRVERSQRQIESLITEPKTYCYKQLKALAQRSKALLTQLGPMTADWYIRTCIERALKDISPDTLILPDLTERERKHLNLTLKSLLDVSPIYELTGDNEQSHITDKARSLIVALTRIALPELRGIVFVEQRAAVHGLAYILRQCPEILSKFTIGTFVGSSTHESRASVAEISAEKEQLRDLQDFREGRKNLMIATSVLEEGIDITACNLVICFDRPMNLISYVQRRGRARQKESRYIIFLDSEEVSTDPAKWRILEAQMKSAYMDESRTFTRAEADDENTLNKMRYYVESTGALLTLDNAKSHLFHFCAISMPHSAVQMDLRPTFETSETSGPALYTARVELPPIVHPTLRTATSSQAWRNEATAIKDAAFQAYIALHRAGLVNDNLLPLVKDYGPDEGQIHLDQPSIIQVSQRISAWRQLFTTQDYESMTWYPGVLRLSLGGNEIISLVVWLPCMLPAIGPVRLYWNEQLTYTVKVSLLHDGAPTVDPVEIRKMRRFTRIMLASVFGSRMDLARDDFPVLFSCEDALGIEGQEPASILLNRDPTFEPGLIRVQGQPGKAYIYAGLSVGDEKAKVDTPDEIEVTSFPKRRDFLHPILERIDMNTAYGSKQAFAIADCSVERLPMRYSLLAAFVPSIMHRIEVTLLAEHLRSTVLGNIGTNDLALIIEAISSPSAGEGVDYNRLEYLGDTILKFCTVLQVTAQHPYWPPSYLSLEKYRLVSNNFLTKAALELGLDEYILTSPFTGAKWRPPYVNELLANLNERGREMSSKRLADVVESLTGAAFVEGGLERAMNCIQTFLPNESFPSHQEAICRLVKVVSPCAYTDVQLLETLVGHHFDSPTLLIEAVTHISCPQNRTGFSYERLEFVGDAVLDLIIVPKLFYYARNLKHWELNAIHGALVSGHFLGYCCMDCYIEEDRYDAVEESSENEKHSMVNGKTFQVSKSKRRIHLHDFLRADGQTIKAKQQSLERFAKHRDAVDEGLKHRPNYPWPDLAAMRPQKFISDLVESVLGALYLDSKGDLAICEAFLKKLGVLRHMRRFLDDNVDTTHPKERLGILAGSKTVEYVHSRVEGTGDTKTFSCLVKVGGVDITSAIGCDSREEANTKAASKAAAEIPSAGTPTSGTTRKRKLDIAATDTGHEDALQ